MKKTVDYTAIRGFNYTQPDARDDCDFWLRYSHETVDRDTAEENPYPRNTGRVPGTA